MLRHLAPVLFVGFSALIQAQVPLPASFQQAQGKFTLKADDQIQINSPAAAKEAEKLAEGLRLSTGFPLKVVSTEARVRVGMDESLTASVGKEGYQLNITTGQVQLTAADSEGLFHGIQATLVAQQMAAQQQLQGMRAQIPERSGPPEGPGYI
jgi:N-acetyl-beta-hexosaminidase